MRLDLGLRVQGLGLRAMGLGFRDQYSLPDDVMRVNGFGACEGV